MEDAIIKVIKGAKGVDGINGFDGVDGRDGKDGLNGKDGKDGRDGLRGAQGPKGDKGDKGEKGEQGDIGLPGKNGLDGKDGENFDPKTFKTFSDELVYKVNDKISSLDTFKALGIKQNGVKVGNANEINFIGATVANNSQQGVDVTVTGGSSITLKTNGTNNGSQSILNLKQGTNVTLADDGVGGVTVNSAGGAPGGSNTQIQFNNSGSFGGDSNLVWDNTNKRLGKGGTPTQAIDMVGAATDQLLLRNTGSPGPGTTYDSPQFALQGTVWNSSGGPATSNAYIQLKTVQNNRNPTIDKLSFFVGASYQTPIEQMSISTTGALDTAGGAHFAPPSFQFINEVMAVNAGASSNGSPIPSNIIGCKGNSWNSAQGGAATIGYMQMRNIQDGTNPTIERLSFWVGSASYVNDYNYGYIGLGTVPNATEVFCATTEGRVGIGNTAPTSTLQVTGSASLPIRVTVAGSTATISDYTILCNATFLAITIALPPAAGCTGRIYVIKKIDSSANTVTIDADASETIDGALTKVISTQWTSLMIQSNGLAWYIISNF